jgi:hypothetical protein
MDTFDVGESDVKVEKTLEARVWAVMKPNNLIAYVDIADSLREIPWAVLRACKRLVRTKRAVEGRGELKNFFKRS